MDGVRHAIRRRAVLALTETSTGGTSVAVAGGCVLLLDLDLDATLAALT